MLAHQESAGDENAKIKISAGDTVLIAEQEVTSTDDSNPDKIVFEVTGVSGNSVNLSVELLNDYYVDSSTDRNAIIHEIWYTDKADGANYKQLDNNTFDDTRDFVTMTDSDFQTRGHSDALLPLNSPMFESTISNLTSDSVSVSEWSSGGYIIITNGEFSFDCSLTETSSPASLNNYPWLGESSWTTDGAYNITK